jgi:hypothetical protein
VSDTLTVIQASAAAVSALTAAYLVYVTLRRDRQTRSERKRDLVNEQLRRISDGLAGMYGVALKEGAMPWDLEVMQARLAAALALAPVSLPSCEALVADDLPKPPYRMGDDRLWKLLQPAVREVVAFARTAGEANPV